MGILASIPKILQLNITTTELLLDGMIAFVFTLSIWYYNLYNIPKFSVIGISRRQISKKILLSIGFGLLIMFLLVLLYYFIFPLYSLLSMLLMYEFRGILINFIVFLFIQYLYKDFHVHLVKLQLEKIKTDNIKAQYEVLKQQVNPHFLFNSLNTLKAMIDIHDRQASDFVVKLSDFYRFSLENRNEDAFLLHKELTILDAYIFLLKSRFEEGFQIEVTISEQTRSTFIPPFTLQLLIENSIKHNIISLDKPLYIQVFENNEGLVIQNNVQPKKNIEKSSGIGLSNIKGRYIHLTSQHIEITHNADYFKVKLPFVYEFSHY